MAFKGIRTYTSEESGNILMGQTGFAVIPASRKLYLVDGIPTISLHNGTSAAPATSFKGKVQQFPMIRCVDAGDIAMHSIAGDHFSSTGAAPADGSLNALAAGLADTFYGAFDEVWTDANTVVLAYFG
tara:strand:- start:486 stop:869 length:384 start_codon:yes stop_codon:yes gene_type:complete